MLFSIYYILYVFFVYFCLVFFLEQLVDGHNHMSTFQVAESPVKLKKKMSSDFYFSNEKIGCFSLSFMTVNE